MLQPNAKIRVVMQRSGPDAASIIFRGNVVTATEQMVMLVGRRFAKVLDAATNRAEEKPLDAQEKTYLVPIGAVRFVEVIVDGSPEDLLDQKIRQEPMIRRKGAFALLD